MKNIYDNAIKAIISIVLVGIFMLGLLIHFDLEKLQPIECGACGAMVHDVWYTENINTGEQVAVCERCMDAVNAE